MAKYKVKHLLSAQKDINDAITHIAQKLENLTAAENLLEEIDEKVESLRSGHWRGQELRNHSSGWFVDIDMNWCTIKNYYLFFRFDETDMVLKIYHFSHKSRGLDHILKETDF